MLRAAIYARISDADGDTKHLGINRQIREGQEYCKLNGLDCTQEFQEDDRSASSFSHRPREQYADLMAQLAEGVFDAVVARHPDRLWRRPREAEEFLDLADRQGVELHFFDGAQIRASDPAGRAMLRVAITFAALESDIKSQRIRSKHRELAEQGAWHGGRTPYGYRRGKSGGLVLDRTEASIIRKCTKRVLAGEGLASVTDDLNARGVQTRAGRPWKITTLRGILTSDRIAGLRTHHGEIFTAQWPEIVSYEDLIRLRATIAGRGGTRSRRRTYLLSGGLAVCGICGSWLHAQPRLNDKRSYRCLSSKGGCSGISIAAEPFEALVVEMFLHVADVSGLPQAEGAADLDALIEEDEALLEELGRDRADKRISRDEHLTMRQRVDERLQANRARQSRSALNRYSDKGRLREAWPDLTTGEHRLLLSTALDRIVVKPGRPGPIFDPSRVETIWAR